MQQFFATRRGLVEIIVHVSAFCNTFATHGLQSLGGRRFRVPGCFSSDARLQ
jgi:hypothetical protein